MAQSPIIPIPEKFKVFYDRDQLVIRRKWFSPALFFLIPFTMFWDGFMVMWFYISITQEIYIMAAFGTLHGLVGLGLTYFVICSFVNATDITVDHQHVGVKIHPFPWPGSKQISTTNITQLYCDERVTRNKNGTSLSYSVKIIDQNGKSIKLVSGLRDPEEAKFIESKVEEILGIKNQTVAGEY